MSVNNRDVVVIWDYNEKGDQVLQKAAQLAKSKDAGVRVVAFYSDAYKGQVDDPSLAKLEKEVEAGAEQAFSDINVVSCKVIDSNDISDCVDQIVGSENVDSVIKLGHRTESAFYTPTDWQLIRRLKCDLFIASPHKWRSKSVVIATVDIDCNSEQQKHINSKVLATADQLARENNLALHVNYVIKIAKPLTELDIVEPDEMLAKKGAETRQKLSEWVKAEGVDAAGCHVTAGDPAKEIPSLSSKLKADVLVMGSVGRKGIKGLLLGNTAEKVIHHLRTDLLVVKP